MRTVGRRGAPPFLLMVLIFSRLMWRYRQRWSARWARRKRRGYRAVTPRVGRPSGPPEGPAFGLPCPGPGALRDSRQSSLIERPGRPTYPLEPELIWPGRRRLAPRRRRALAVGKTLPPGAMPRYLGWGYKRITAARSPPGLSPRPVRGGPLLPDPLAGLEAQHMRETGFLCGRIGGAGPASEEVSAPWRGVRGLAEGVSEMGYQVNLELMGEPIPRAGVGKPDPEPDCWAGAVRAGGCRGTRPRWAHATGSELAQAAPGSPQTRRGPRTDQPQRSLCAPATGCPQSQSVDSKKICMGASFGTARLPGSNS